MENNIDSSQKIPDRAPANMANCNASIQVLENRPQEHCINIFCFCLSSIGVARIIRMDFCDKTIISFLTIMMGSRKNISTASIPNITADT